MLALLGASVITIALQSHCDQTNFFSRKHLNSSCGRLCVFSSIVLWEQESVGDIRRRRWSICNWPQACPNKRGEQGVNTKLSLAIWDSIQYVHSQIPTLQTTMECQNDHETFNRLLLEKRMWDDIYIDTFICFDNGFYYCNCHLYLHLSFGLYSEQILASCQVFT